MIHIVQGWLPLEKPWLQWQAPVAGLQWKGVNVTEPGPQGQAAGATEPGPRGRAAGATVHGLRYEA